MQIPTIGLEIHVELKTQTKMFCGCPNDPEETHPNVNVCPICLAHPGTLPTMNKEAIKAVIKAGLALGGEIALDSHFDRKSYFYPDLPKGYQISQYEEPLVKGGILKDIRIRRIHLEEDTGRLLHELPSHPKDADEASFVDYNRAGVPLMELVTEPDVKTAEEAVTFAKELQLILRYLGVSNADMEKGQMRVEANISLDMETKVEVKNINSFRAVKGAIEYEIERQKEAVKEKKKIIQETRGWNERKGITESQRTKESAHDYRYFSEPDLPPLDLRQFGVEDLRHEIPELPEAKRRRFVEEFGMNREQADRIIENIQFANYFEATASEFKTLVSSGDFSLLINYFISDFWGLLNDRRMNIEGVKVKPEHFAHLISLVVSGDLTSRLAKDLLVTMFETGEDPEGLIEKSGLKLMDNLEELKKIVAEIVTDNPKAVEDYKAKKGNSIQFLIGQGIARTRGQANPGILKELFEKQLNS